MWWHLIPRLAPVLTGQDRRGAGHIRGVLCGSWRECRMVEICGIGPRPSHEKAQEKLGSEDATMRP
jgi:hypothetical protein